MLGILKRQIQTFLPVMASGTVCLLIVSKSAITSHGIINGLKICSNIIIPSLFPFMVFSSFVVKSGIYIKIGKILGKPIRWIFNLPTCASGAVVMGLIGGYPIGISMTAELLEIGAIEEHHAKRMALFSVNAGPAFIISAVGEAIYKSRNVGLILFASVILSSLTIGILTGTFSRIKGEESKENFVPKSDGRIITAFVSSAESASRGILSICVWVVTFGAIIAFVKSLPIEKEISVILCGILEVTSGCTLSAGVLPISITASFIAFSGFCIFFQLIPNIKKIGIRIPLFLLTRLICGILAFSYCTILTRIFPNSAEVFSNGITPLVQNFSISIPTTVCLIATAVVLIFDVDRKKKIC